MGTFVINKKVEKLLKLFMKYLNTHEISIKSNNSNLM